MEDVCDESLKYHPNVKWSGGETSVFPAVCIKIMM